jgi:hypothetical protein
MMQYKTNRGKKRFMEDIGAATDDNEESEEIK